MSAYGHNDRWIAVSPSAPRNDDGSGGVKPFVAWVNVLGGTLFWIVVTAVLFFYLSFPNYSTGVTPPMWPRIILIAFSIGSWSLMVRHYLRKSKR